MNEAGVLGAFVRAFGRVVAMMQFNMYHHYTVDEHLIRCMGVMSEIEAGTNEEYGLANELVKKLPPRQRALLRITLFLHDIAKGRVEDHSIAGARVARRLCPRLGLSNAETETVAWLIENHLVMSTVAQSRDLSDRKTIENFAAIAQSLDRLKLLLVLTTADIRAVGPGVWNGWKAQLLRTLYYETEPALTGGFSEVNRERRVAMAQAEFRDAMKDWPVEELDGYIARHYPAYWLKVDLPRKIAQAHFLREAWNSGKTLATQVSFDAARGVTELTVIAPDHPRLLSIIAGACAAAGGNIVDAQIYTTTDGLALDTISLTREFERDEDEGRRAGRIADTIEKALQGEIKMPDVVARRAAPEGAAQGLRARTGSQHQQRMVEPLYRCGSHGHRPAGTALRTDRDHFQAIAQHHLGACRDLRRARGRRVLCHRPARRQNRIANTTGCDQARACSPCSPGPPRSPPPTRSAPTCSVSAGKRRRSIAPAPQNTCPRQIISSSGPAWRPTCFATRSRAASPQRIRASDRPNSGRLEPWPSWPQVPQSVQRQG